jgi:hypothetical protein
VQRRCRPAVASGQHRRACPPIDWTGLHIIRSPPNSSSRRPGPLRCAAAQGVPSLGAADTAAASASSHILCRRAIGPTSHLFVYSRLQQPLVPQRSLTLLPPSQQDVNSPTRGARLTPHRTTLCSHSPNGIWTTLRTAEDRAAFGGRLGHESCTKRPPLQPLSPPAFSSGLPLSPTTGLPSQRCEGLAPGVWVTQWRLQRVNHNVNRSNCSIRVYLPSAASPMACPCHRSNALLTSSR